MTILAVIGGVLVFCVGYFLGWRGGFSDGVRWLADSERPEDAQVFPDLYTKYAQTTRARLERQKRSGYKSVKQELLENEDYQAALRAQENGAASVQTTQTPPLG